MAVQGGFGVVVKIDISATMTAIAHIIDAEFPKLEKILADVTAHDSTGGWDEVIATGKRKSGEFNVTLAWDKSGPTHAAILTAFASDSPVNMSIADPDAVETISFAAHIQSVERIAEQEEGYQCKVTIKPTGPITIT